MANSNGCAEEVNGGESFHASQTSKIPTKLRHYNAFPLCSYVVLSQGWRDIGRVASPLCGEAQRDNRAKPPTLPRDRIMQTSSGHFPARRWDCTRRGGAGRLDRHAPFPLRGPASFAPPRKGAARFLFNPQPHINGPCPPQPPRVEMNFPRPV